jgi:cytidylate kinase
MKKIVIVISSPPGAGGTTVARKLAKKLRLKFFSLGIYYKKLSKEKNQSKAAFELWKTKYGSSEKLHKNMDIMQTEMGKKGNIVIESTLGIHFLKKLSKYKIWLDVPLKVRAERAAKRDKMEVEEALKKISEREDIERMEWKRMYGFDYFDQKYEADFVLDSSNMTPIETVRKILKFIKSR